MLGIDGCSMQTRRPKKKMQWGRSRVGPLFLTRMFRLTATAPILLWPPKHENPCSLALAPCRWEQPSLHCQLGSWLIYSNRQVFQCMPRCDSVTIARAEHGAVVQSMRSSQCRRVHSIRQKFLDLDDHFRRSYVLNTWAFDAPGLEGLDIFVAGPCQLFRTL